MGYGMAEDGLRGRFSPSAPNTYYLFEWDPQGSLVQRQTGGAGGNTSYYALDTAMFDGYGAKLGDTDAFTGGNEATRDAMGFQGQFGAYTDNETGLVLMGHRYYDAGTGRFLTRDPKGYGGGINLYGFTGNNPVNESDPEGLDFGDYVKGIGDAINPIEAAKGLVSLGRYLASGHANAKAFGKAVLTGLNPADANATDRQSGQRAMGDGLLLAGGYGVFSKLRALGAAGTIAAAAEGTTSTGIVLSSEAAFNAALVQDATGGAEVVSGFKIYGAKGLVGNVYVRNVLSIEAIKKSSSPLSSLVNSLESEARASGASRLEIAGQAIINKGFLNPSIARRYGFAYSKVGGTVFFTKTVK